jgi:lipoprotein-anchoring transpeptidase ErfK/SrfK
MPINRRDFLKLSSSALGILALEPLHRSSPPWLPEDMYANELLGRVTHRGTHVYSDPDLLSQTLDKLPRDRLVRLLEELTAPHGPAHNLRWYRLERGYVHSAYIQRIEQVVYTAPLERVPAAGTLGEVKVPYTQASYKNRLEQWQPLFRLYYGSIHWVTAVEKGPLGDVFYHLYDDWLRLTYRVSAEHIQPVPGSRFTPLSPDFPAEQKRLEVSIERQILTAYEGRQIMREVPVSTGRRWTPTPKGQFQIDRKHPSRHMGDGGLTSDIHAYELVGVPWVSFFQSAGIAFHGTFWHDNFGEPMSMGCVNMPTDDALWLFRWSKPVYQSLSDERPTYRVVEKGGTQVVVV